MRMNGINLSTVRIGNAEKIEIQNGGYGNRKFILDGKEVDLAKVQNIKISFNCEGIRIEADIIGGSMPIKE